MTTNLPDDPLTVWERCRGEVLDTQSLRELCELLARALRVERLQHQDHHDELRAAYKIGR